MFLKFYLFYDFCTDEIFHFCGCGLVIMGRFFHLQLLGVLQLKPLIGEPILVLALTTTITTTARVLKRSTRTTLISLSKPKPGPLQLHHQQFSNPQTAQFRLYVMCIDEITHISFVFRFLFRLGCFWLM